MRFRLIDAAKEEFPIHRICDVLGVSASGYFAWRGRPVCRRRREDLILLAHVRSAFAQSNGTYGSPRMTRELQDGGLAIGRRRTARLMGENGLRARQKRRFKRTTDSHHTFPVAPNLLGQDFTAERPNQKWEPISAMSGPARDGCIWPSSLTCLPGASLAGPLAIACIGNWLSKRSPKPLPCGGREPA